jgi:hypothetical protein
MRDSIMDFEISKYHGIIPMERFPRKTVGLLLRKEVLVSALEGEGRARVPAR